MSKRGPGRGEWHVIGWEGRSWEARFDDVSGWWFLMSAIEMRGASFLLYEAVSKYIGKFVLVFSFSRSFILVLSSNFWVLKNLLSSLLEVKLSITHSFIYIHTFIYSSYVLSPTTRREKSYLIWFKILQRKKFEVLNLELDSLRFDRRFFSVHWSYWVGRLQV